MRRAKRPGNHDDVGVLPEPPSPVRPDRRHPVARRIIASWRELLTRNQGRGSGEPTLIACSGGADSVALAISLASTGADLALAFARHDARSAPEVERDLAVVRRLARALGVDCVELDCPSGAGKTPSEASMRSARYRALAMEARARSIRFVATGHHADDQLETVLLAMIRGAGPSGMAGMEPSRPIDDREPRVHLIRPMLGISRGDAERLCLDSGLTRPGSGGFSWATDKTNEDAVYLRNRVRHELVPVLESLNPGMAERVSLNAEWFRQISSLLRTQAIELDQGARRASDESSMSWSRQRLADRDPVVLGELLRWCVETRFERKGLDRLTGATLRQVAEAIRDDTRDPRRFEPGDGLVIEVTAHSVSVSRKNPAGAGLE